VSLEVTIFARRRWNHHCPKPIRRLSLGLLGLSPHYRLSTSKESLSRPTRRRMIYQPRLVLRRHLLHLRRHLDVDAHHNQLYPDAYHPRLNPFQPSVDQPPSDETPTHQQCTRSVRLYQVLTIQIQGTSPHLSHSFPYPLLCLDYEHKLNNTGLLFRLDEYLRL
jgi:hypothetical protein